MKSILLSFVLIIILISPNFGQNPNGGEPNSPGEKVNVKTKSNFSFLEKEYSELELKVEADSQKIQSLYFVEEEVAMEYGAYATGGTKTTIRHYKKKIYKAGQILIEHNKSQLSKLKPNELTERIDLLKEISRTQGQLIYFSNQENTRAIEKTLKKLKTPEKIHPVFFEEL